MSSSTSSTGGTPPPKSSAKAKNDRRKAKQQQQAQELAKLRAEVAQFQQEKALLQQLQREKELQNVSASGIIPLSASVPGTQVPVPKAKKSTASDTGQQKGNSFQGTSAKPKPVASPSSPQKGKSSQGTSTVTEKAHNKTSGRSLSTLDFNQIEAGYSSEINALMSSLDLGMRTTLKEFFKSELRASDQIIEALELARLTCSEDFETLAMTTPVEAVD